MEIEYEYLFESEPGESCPIDGWLPVATSRFRRPVSELLALGKIRPIERKPLTDKEKLAVAIAALEEYADALNWHFQVSRNYTGFLPNDSCYGNSIAQEALAQIRQDASAA